MVDAGLAGVARLVEASAPRPRRMKLVSLPATPEGPELEALATGLRWSRWLLSRSARGGGDGRTRWRETPGKALASPGDRPVEPR
jgi:hypothetical protein